MPNELKPCPFCGGAARLYHTEHTNLNNRKHYFNCEKCGTYFLFYTNTKYISQEQTEQEAIEAWNRRIDNA